MAAHSVKTERACREPETACRKPAPAQVADDHTHSRDAIELAQDADHTLVAEVVQQLRAEHDVKAALRKRQRARVAGDSWHAGISRGVSHDSADVNAYDVEPNAVLSCLASGAQRDVTNSGAHIQHTDDAWGLRSERSPQLVQDDTRSTEVGVGPSKIVHRGEPCRIIHIRVVQKLDPSKSALHT